MEAANDNTTGDLLIGAPAISKYLGVSARQTYRLTTDKIIPHFRLGGSLAARRSTLTTWMAAQEAAARAS